jgi:hypothetical protein
MSSRFTISISEREWSPIAEAPLDGTIIFIRDQFDHVDLAKWSNGEWAGEHGICSEPEWFATLYIFAV